MHHRKPSKEKEEENGVAAPRKQEPSDLHPLHVIASNGVEHGGGRKAEARTGEHAELQAFRFGDSEAKPGVNGVNGHDGHDQRIPSPRNRVSSTPIVSSPPHDQVPHSHSHSNSHAHAHSYSHSPSVPTQGLHRSPIPSPGYLANGVAQSHTAGVPRHQAPALRQSLSLPSQSSHARTRSVSGPYTPSTPSPLATSFPIPQSASYPQGANSSNGPSSSPTRMRVLSNGSGLPSSSANANSHNRRHSRLHSRNLSIYFPRPGSLPSTSIDEDGGQEIDFSVSPSYASTSNSDEGVIMPSSSPGPGQRSFREGFTFGARPPGSSPATPGSSDSSKAARRGHHHKHSLSHNFFSFLEPGGVSEEYHTEPTQTPISPWNPISPFPAEKGQTVEGSTSSAPRAEKGHGLGVTSRAKSPVGRSRAPPGIDYTAVFVTVVQFFLGASLWVVGQQIGSLSCTGLGYWVVFDSFGVCLGRVLPGWLAKSGSRSGAQHSYGNARLETLVTYAQAIYLLFASVYVCKETIEHLLLSAGEGHHHHRGDEVTDIYGIDFPPYLLCVTLISLLGTASIFNNQSKLVSAAGNYIPPIHSLIPTQFRYSISRYTYPPLIANLLSNPFVLAPITFCASILCAFYAIPSHYHRSFDLLLAGIETVVTFSLAYPAAVALGAVLLQTAPPRGLPGGRMETFLRAMREIERHDQVLHLPPPHIWQLAPYYSRPESLRSLDTFDGPAQSLVVTLELHVPRTLPDDDVLKLTAWAWERCKTALKHGTRDGGGEGEAEVTIGIVRG